MAVLGHLLQQFVARRRNTKGIGAPLAAGLMDVALSCDEERPAFVQRALHDGFVPVE